MSKEANDIVKRRFLGRVIESSLLVIAIALGVGAATSGLSLYFHSVKIGNELLNSPEYKEIVVTTRGNADDMETSLVEMAKTEETALTTRDLEVGEIIPVVAYSYIISDSRIRLNSSEKNSFPGAPPEGTPKEPPQNQDNIEKSLDSIVESEIEEIFGKEVTKEFFDSRNIETSFGSLFTDKDYTSRDTLIIIGSDLALELSENSPESLIGMKIPAWNSYYTVVGITKESGEDYDNYFFVPKKELSSNSNFFRKGPGMDSQLRFMVSDTNELQSAANQLETWFKREYGESQIVVSNPRDEAVSANNRNRGISFLILFLSLAGLFIASVNSSNILMSRALRMKKHVGILKALGASQNGILKLFTVEALTVTILGAIVGTLFSIPLSRGMEESMGLGGISPVYIVLGILLSTFICLLFTIIPARLNSKIVPAEAMRS